MDFDIVVLGAIGIDTNVYLHGKDIDFTVEANFSKNIDYIGGAGGYSSRLANCLGYKIAFSGYVGDDYQGRYIISSLKKSGINTEFIFMDPDGTKRSINFMYRDGRRKNFYDARGAMTNIPDLDKVRDLLKKTKLVHVNISNWTRYALPIAKELGVIISCDIQDVVKLDDPYRVDYIEMADILFFSGVNLPEPDNNVHELLAKYAEKIIIVGMGEKGCIMGYKGEVSVFPAIYMDQPVVDTNGAGDSLAIGFLTSYVLENKPIEKSLEIAQTLARYVCTMKADSTNFPSKSQLDKMMIDNIE